MPKTTVLGEQTEQADWVQYLYDLLSLDKYGESEPALLGEDVTLGFSRMGGTVRIYAGQREWVVSVAEETKVAAN